MSIKKIVVHKDDGETIEYPMSDGYQVCCLTFRVVHDGAELSQNVAASGIGLAHMVHELFKRNPELPLACAMVAMNEDNQKEVSHGDGGTTH